MKHFTFKNLKQLSIASAFALGLTTMTAHGQTFEWVNGFEGTSDNFGQGIGSDATGNVYSGGYFFGDIDLDPSTGTDVETSEGQQDIYISKTDVDGNYAWGHSFGADLRDRCNDIYVDDAGNVYATGYFEDTVDFDPGVGQSILTAVGERDVFVLKLDTDGELLWVKRFGGLLDGEGVSLKGDENDHIFVSGLFQGTYDFDPTSGSHMLTAEGNRDAFVMELNEMGNLVWVRQFSGLENSYGMSIDLTSNGNLFVGGFYSGTVDFDPSGSSQFLTSNGSFDLFAMKLDNNGELMWVKGYGGTGQERGEGVIVDSDDNLYITGRLQGTVNFDPGNTDTELTAGGGFDGYVLKLDNNGDFQWVNHVMSTSNCISFRLAKDPSDGIYASGYFAGDTDFVSQSGTTSITAVGGNNGFIQKYDIDGNEAWLHTHQGGTAIFSVGISVGDNWDVHSTGYYAGTADFDPSGTNTSLTSVDASDAYTHKLSQTCVAPVFDSINYVAADTLFCPSEMASTELIAIGTLNDAASWEWYTGGCGMTHVASGDTVTFMPTTTTTYYVRAEGACGVPQTCDSITIHVDDLEAPVADVATLGDITEICEVTSLMAPTATDACEGTIEGTHDATLPITTNTTITWTYTDVAGNSSMQTQDVIITGVDVTTSVDGIMLSANNSTVGVAYRWIDCNDNNSPIVNATNQTYTPDMNGSYAVIVLQDGCQDTSACIDVTTVGLEDYSKTNISVYPNPSSGNFNIQLPTADAVNYTITDNAGRIVLEGTFEQLENTIDLSTEEQGVYFLRVEASVMKLVVQ